MAKLFATDLIKARTYSNYFLYTFGCPRVGNENF